jgi:hypothetical protein
MGWDGWKLVRRFEWPLTAGCWDYCSGLWTHAKYRWWIACRLSLGAKCKSHLNWVIGVDGGWWMDLTIDIDYEVLSTMYCTTKTTGVNRNGSGFAKGQQATSTIPSTFCLTSPQTTGLQSKKQNTPGCHCHACTDALMHQWMSTWLFAW